MINPDGYHTPAPQNGDSVICLRSQAGYCPDTVARTVKGMGEGVESVVGGVEGRAYL